MIALNRAEVIGRLGADIHNGLVCPLTIMSTFKPKLRSVLRLLAAAPITIIVALGLSLLGRSRYVGQQNLAGSNGYRISRLSYLSMLAAIDCRHRSRSSSNLPISTTSASSSSVVSPGSSTKSYNSKDRSAEMS